jgi:predicted metal-dependent phosphoesterase TrpH
MALADLHVHTVASDGTWQPVNLVRAAKRLGLLAIAVTDHDTTAGVAETQAVGRAVGLPVIAGVELSTRVGGKEIHVIGLGIDPHDTHLTSVITHMRKSRAKRAELILQRLDEIGLPIPRDRLYEVAGGGVIGRPHVARVMVEAKYVDSVDEAFKKYLGDGCPAYVTRDYLSPATVISTIHKAGGIAVVAHPGLMDSQLDLRGLVNTGFDALEAYHSRHDQEQTEVFLQLARENDLLVSGGSDCHGTSVGRPQLLGSVGVDRPRLARLMTACQQYR